ncbi:MAG: Type secretion system ATPase TadZ/CpaE, partial [Paucimonas sp.]|nr:Type secretion system ATPase TadZ/CpaE [Paucimonas sp.]
MKIVVLSTDKAHLADMSRMLEARSHSVTAVEGRLERMIELAQHMQPDLIVAEDRHVDNAALASVEYVTTHFPYIAVVLASIMHTPEFLIGAMRAGVREVLPSPVPASVLESAVERVAAKLSGGRAKGAGKIMAFLSCKGGCGATFLATNLGYQLAERHSTLLIDLNLQFGDALSFLHDGRPPSTLADIALHIERLDASFLAASTVRLTPNFSILAAPEDAAQAVGIKPEHIEAILSLAVTQYEFVLLDLGRNLDTLTIKALDHAHRIYPVLQSDLPSLRNAKKLAVLFGSLGYPREKTEYIVNRYDKRSEIDLNDMRLLLGTAVLHTVP